MRGVRQRDGTNLTGAVPMRLVASGTVTLSKQLSFGSVTLAHCKSKPAEGRFLIQAEVSVAIHEGAPYEMDWRGSESDRIQSSTIYSGNAHIIDGRLPFWVRSTASPSSFAFSIKEDFIREIWQKDFRGMGDFAIAASFGTNDPVISQICSLARHELSEGGPAGRLYMEGLATTLAVHLLRHYPLLWSSLTRYKGGLSQWRMRRVIDYINAHLSDELGLVELAAITGLSPHYFVAAFKTSIGKTPHQFVIERRIQRALDLLGEEDLSVAEIARATGFSSPSHLTANFRRVTGVTPGRFRRLLA